jgi:NADPH2:quinone reductase
VRVLPHSISFAQGAALNVPYGTAYRALFQRARVQAGETVLVHGGSGGVGVAAIQLARRMGLPSPPRQGSPAGLQLVEEQGAKYVLDHTDPEYVSDALGARVDAALMSFWKWRRTSTWATIWICWHPMDVSWLSAAGAKSQSTRATLWPKNRQFWMRFFNTPPADFSEIFDAIDAGLLADS